MPGEDFNELLLGIGLPVRQVVEQGKHDSVVIGYHLILSISFGNEIKDTGLIAREKAARPLSSDPHPSQIDFPIIPSLFTLP
jgi:hypothetical protein